MESVSFPSGDAILYTMLNQIPPFYNSVGSDSSLEAKIGQFNTLR